MGQEQNVWRNETSTEGEKHLGRKKDESATGRDIPGGDGNVGDGQMDALGKETKGRPTGQDHSTEHYETRDPDHGVGTVQESNDLTADVAHIDE
jgi:hypothetical protein